MKNILIKSIAAIVFGGALFVLVQSCTESQGKGSPIPKSSEPIPVKVVSLKKAEQNANITTSGRITTDDETLLSFKTGGVVDAVLVNEGDRVSKGQVLATLDLTEINSLVSQAKSGMDKAERDLARTRNLYRDSVATLEQLQNAGTAYDLSKQQYNAAMFNKSFSHIKAPAAGFVLKKFVNQGQVVGTGDPVLRTNGAGDGKWILKAGVSDKQWASIRVGNSAKIKVDAFPAAVFDGAVIRKSESADPATGAFTVEVSLSSKNLRFASGMFASAEIDGTEKTTSWNVPYEAVLDANGNEGFVFVATDQKTAIKKRVLIGSFDDSSVRVTNGLEATDVLIVSGSAYLTENSPVQIVK